MGGIEAREERGARKDLVTIPTKMSEEDEGLRGEEGTSSQSFSRRTSTARSQPWDSVLSGEISDNCQHEVFVEPASTGTER